MGQIGGAYVAYATGYAEATRNLSRKHLGPSPSMVTSSRPLPLSRLVILDSSSDTIRWALLEFPF